MIATLTGRIAQKNDRFAILDVGGVGYEVYLTALALRALNTDDHVTVFTKLYEREAGPELYGFLSLEEKLFFERLLTISGIGPKIALGVLAEGNLADIKRAIIHGDSKILMNVSGIGRKTAERIIVELKNTIDISDEVTKGIEAESATAQSRSIDALVGLGYTPIEARRALQEVPGEIVETADRVREALRILGKHRSK